MLYQVEEYETKNEKKLVVLHILMILLVFVVIIGTGIIAYKYIKDKNTLKETSARVTEKKQNNDCYYMDSAMRMDDVHEFMRKSAL